MQRRRPPPNGSQVYVPGGLPRNRSGRNANGSGRSPGRGGRGRPRPAARLRPGTRPPPIRTGCFVRRGSAFGTTGSQAQDLLDGRRQVLVALAGVELVGQRARRRAARRARCTNAHASADAVVSWPATSAVISSSRSSCVAHLRPVLVAGRRAASRGCRRDLRSAPQRARRSRTCAKISSSAARLAPPEAAERRKPRRVPLHRRHDRQRALGEREHVGDGGPAVRRAAGPARARTRRAG